MLAVILKDLRCYAHSRKYRRIQFIVLGLLSFLMLVGAVELYAHRRIAGTLDVGSQVYTLCIIALLVVQFWVPRHAVEALNMERRHLKTPGQKAALLVLAPLANWQILAGKLIALVLWAMWGIWLTVPLLALSIYIGGLELLQWARCGIVLVMSCIFFILVGIGIALWASPTHAKGISSGFVLLITLLPFVPFSLFEAVPVLAAMSPLCALLSIFRADPTQMWMWNIGLFCTLSALIFSILVKWMRF